MRVAKYIALFLAICFSVKSQTVVPPYVAGGLEQPFWAGVGFMATNQSQAQLLLGFTGTNGAGLPKNVVTNFVPPNGVDDTANLQAALTACGASPFTYIRLYPTNYLTSASLICTNNFVLDGQGATIKFLNGATNSMFDCGPYCVNQSFLNLTLDGQQYSNYPVVATYGVWPPLTCEIPNFHSSISNRNAMRINLSAGGYVSHVTCFGFSGVGILTYNYNGTEAYRWPRTLIHDSVCYSNFCGFFNGDGLAGYDGLPTYFPIQNPSSFANDAGEYAMLSHCSGFNNAIGAIWYGGNSKMLDCDFENNYIGLEGGGGNNAQHGGYVGSTFNHNNYGAILNSALGEFDVCQFQANINAAAMGFDGETFEFRSCYFNIGSTPTAVILTNDVGNITIHNYASFVGCSDAIGYPTNLVWVNASNCVAFGAANIEPFGFDDGSFSRGIWEITNTTSTGNGVLSYPYAYAGNGGGLTNINALALTNTVPLSALPSAVVTNGDTRITSIGTLATTNFTVTSSNTYFIKGLSSADIIESGSNTTLETTSPNLGGQIITNDVIFGNNQTSDAFLVKSTNGVNNLLRVDQNGNVTATNFVGNLTGSTFGIITNTFTNADSILFTNFNTPGKGLVAYTNWIGSIYGNYALDWVSTNGVVNDLASTTNSGNTVFRTSNGATLTLVAQGGGAVNLVSSGYIYLNANSSGGINFQQGANLVGSYNQTVVNGWSFTNLVVQFNQTNAFVSQAGTTNVLSTPNTGTGLGQNIELSSSYSVTNFTGSGMITNIQSYNNLSGLTFYTNIVNITKVGEYDFILPSSFAMTNGTPITNAFQSGSAGTFSGLWKISYTAKGAN